MQLKGNGFFSLPLEKKSQHQLKDFHWRRCISFRDVQEHQIFPHEVAEGHPNHLPDALDKSCIHKELLCCLQQHHTWGVRWAGAGWGPALGEDFTPKGQMRHVCASCLGPLQSTRQVPAPAQILASLNGLARIPCLLGQILLIATCRCEKMQWLC